MLINSERALAYVVTIDEIRPLEGYDRVEYARTNGWWVVISKNDGLKLEISASTSRSIVRFLKMMSGLSFSKKGIIRLRRKRCARYTLRGFLCRFDYSPNSETRI